MKTTHISTRFGGQVVEILETAHGTEDGVGFWFFVARTRYEDGPLKDVAVGPQDICCDNSNPAAHAEMNEIMGAMNAYLLEAGAWHKMKSKRDGRCYSWTPKKPSGSKPIAEMIEAQSKLAA